MLTGRQIEATRPNARHSTGPSTPEGRAAVRLNGLKHGLCAETIVVPGEDPAEFEAMLEAYCAEYQPATPSAEFLVRQVAMADWRLLRLYRIEARSEEHTSELQSLRHLVCRLLLEKKNVGYLDCSNMTRCHPEKKNDDRRT